MLDLHLAQVHLCLRGRLLQPQQRWLASPERAIPRRIELPVAGANAAQGRACVQLVGGSDAATLSFNAQGTVTPNAVVSSSTTFAAWAHGAIIRAR